ncbi:MAG: O-antigen ligase family protein, partial [Candidatus Omnitrophota bacterium]
GVLLVWGFRTIVHRDFNFVKSKENFLLILYLALVIISGIKSWDFSSSALIQQTIKVAVLYLIIVNMIKTRRQALIIIGVIVVIGTIAALMGSYQYFTGASRVEGPERDPNFFAMHLVLAFPIVVNLIWMQKKKLMKVVLVGITVLFLATIVFTYSRMAMLALGGVIALLAVRPFFQKPRRRAPLISLIVMIILAVPFIPSSYWLRAKTIVLRKGDISIESRLNALQAGLEMIRDYPVRGVGFGIFQYKYIEYARPSYIFHGRMSAHNMYIELAAESGIPALVAFLFVVFFALKELKKARRIFQDKGDVLLLDISNAIEIAIIGFLIGGFFLSQLYLLIFWMCIAFSIALRQISMNNSLLSYKANIKARGIR